MYQKPSAALGGRVLVKANLPVKSTPLMVRLTRFQLLIWPPRLLERQHKVPAPSNMKGAVIVDATGLQVVLWAIVPLSEPSVSRDNASTRLTMCQRDRLRFDFIPSP